jgi:hypothetical protein
MAIVFACEHCGKRFEVSDDLAGKRGRCKQCGLTFVIPGKRPAATPSARPKAAPPVSDPFGFDDDFGPAHQTVDPEFDDAPVLPKRLGASPAGADKTRKKAKRRQSNVFSLADTYGGCTRLRCEGRGRDDHLSRARPTLGQLAPVTILALVHRVLDMLLDVGEDLAVAEAAAQIEPGEHGVNVMAARIEPLPGQSPGVVAPVLGQLGVEHVKHGLEFIERQEQRGTSLGPLARAPLVLQLPLTLLVHRKALVCYR